MLTPVVAPQNRPLASITPDPFIVGLERPMVVRPVDPKPIGGAR